VTAVSHSTGVANVTDTGAPPLILICMYF
jgi:hypothetical protein